MTEHSDIKLILGDCIDVVAGLEPQSVDAIITDVPYGTTKIKWDTIIPFDDLWRIVKHVLKPNGVFVTTSCQPFSSALVMSNPKMFSYEWIWVKNRGSGHLNARKVPMRYHENVLVFYYGTPTYNPIHEDYSETSKRRAKSGSVYSPKTKKSKENIVYGKFNNNPTIRIRCDGRYPSTVKYFDVVNIQNGGRIHPTQKPLPLFEYLIKTHSNEGDTVMDICMGSGTTMEACVNTGRKGIGIEKEQKYYDIAVSRLGQS